MKKHSIWKIQVHDNAVMFWRRGQKMGRGSRFNHPTTASWSRLDRAINNRLAVCGMELTLNDGELLL